MNPIVRRINDDPKLRISIRDKAEELGDPLTLQAIHDWKKLKGGVPPSRVVLVAGVLGLPPHKIRPDIFPPPEGKAQSKGAYARNHNHQQAKLSGRKSKSAKHQHN